MAFRLSDLADRFNCDIVGDPATEITSVCTLQDGNNGGISFLANRKYRKHLPDTNASAVILRRSDVDQCPVPALVHDNPYACYARIAAYIASPSSVVASVHPSAIIHERAQIGDDVFIGPHVVIDENTRIGDGAYIGPGCVLSANVRLGDNAYLHSNITVYEGCEIGHRARIHAGVVIGADGFGIAQDEGIWIKVPQLGRVIIGDDVEIGASTTIDRGAIEDTVIGNGVKLDNQIQIGHNVHLGDHTAIAGCVGVAGSAVIGRRCTIGAMTLVLGHLELADDVHITAQSLVTKSLPKPGVYSSGTPLQDNAVWKRNFTRFGQLDDMAKRLKNLERQVVMDDDSSTNG